MVPVCIRKPNPALGYDRDGREKTEVVRVCDVTIIRVTLEPLEAATPEDATSEGFRSLDDLLEAYGGVEGLWHVLSIVLDPALRPRFLSRAVVAGRRGDYTESSARGLIREPEAVDIFTQERISEEAARQAAERKRLMRLAQGRMSPAEEAEALYREARERHIDVRDEMRAVRRWSGNTQAQAIQVKRMRAKLGADLDLANVIA